MTPLSATTTERSRRGESPTQRRLVALGAVLSCLLQSLPVAAQETYDVLFLDGRVLDGTGNPWFRADVGVKDGRIAAIGRLHDIRATRTIDLAGRVLTPGFIDIHSHADGPGGETSGLRSNNHHVRSAPNLVAQGITTVVVNQDGRSPSSIADQRKRLEELGHGPNAILMVGHNSIRREALGEEFRRAATRAETRRMAELLRQGIAEGAYGLTAGLEYVPGRWSDPLEVTELVAVMVETGGVAIVHERASGADPMWFLPSRHPPNPPTMVDNIEELITLAEGTGVPVVATHIKVKGADYWGASTEIVNLVRDARDRGVEIWLDQYPYDTTGSDGATVLIPPWALEYDRWGESSDGDDDETRDFGAILKVALEDQRFREDLERDIVREISRRGGPDRIFVYEHPDESLVGLTLRELSERWDESLVDAAIRLQLEGFTDRPGGARLRGFSLNEMDLEPLAAEPYTITASDAGIAIAEEGQPVHARFYGTFPRKIRRYALERGVLSVADAIRSATSLPAQVLRLRSRGLVREGMVADLVVIDLDRVRDLATFESPHQFPEGIDWVLVRGEAVVENGELTGALPGVVLTLEDSAF